jgi:hypothetical protein
MGENVDVASHQEAFDHLKAVRAELLGHYRMVRELAADDGNWSRPSSTKAFRRPTSAANSGSPARPPASGHVPAVALWLRSRVRVARPLVRTPSSCARPANTLTASRILAPASANRDQAERRFRVGTRNTRSIYGGLGHLQQCSRSVLSTLGGGGNRTRVLQYLTRASPGAACFAFLSPGDHASKTPTGSVTV